MVDKICSNLFNTIAKDTLNSKPYDMPQIGTDVKVDSNGFEVTTTKFYENGRFIGTQGRDKKTGRLMAYQGADMGVGEVVMGKDGIRSLAISSTGTLSYTNTEYGTHKTSPLVSAMECDDGVFEGRLEDSFELKRLKDSFVELLPKSMSMAERRAMIQIKVPTDSFLGIDTDYVEIDDLFKRPDMKAMPELPSKMHSTCWYGNSQSLVADVSEKGASAILHANTGGWGGADISSGLYLSYAGEEEGWKITANRKILNLTSKEPLNLVLEGAQELCGSEGLLSTLGDHAAASFFFCEASTEGSSEENTEKVRKFLDFLNGAKAVFCS